MGRRIVVFLAGLFLACLGGFLGMILLKIEWQGDLGDIGLTLLGAIFGLGGLYLIGVSICGSQQTVNKTYKGLLSGL